VIARGEQQSIGGENCHGLYNGGKYNKISVNILDPVLELNMPVLIGFWHVVTLLERNSCFAVCLNASETRLIPLQPV
jgi:hypothetical protein